MVSTTRKILLAAVPVAVALAGALAAGSARAGSDVFWSIGINAPIDRGVSVGTVISNAPVYAPPPPVVVYPQPVYAPPPVVYAPPPRVIYRPAPVYVPAPVVYGAPVYVDRHRHGHRHDHRGDWKRGKHWKDDHRGDRHDDWRRYPGQYRGDPIVYSPR